MPSPSDKRPSAHAAAPKSATVLVVDDEPTIVEIVGRYMERAGFETYTAADGYQALDAATEHRPDLVVLDVMLPGIDGYETCRRMRRDGVWAPVLMLTARGAIDDRVAGLDGGADDYMVKPFAFAELLARLRALVRRGTVERPPVIEVGDLRLDPGTREVWRGEEEIDLSSKEFTLMETFMRHAGYVLSRNQLLEQAWDYDFEHRSNVVEVYIRYVREKIDRPFGRNSLQTVRGVGYRICDEA